MAEFNIVRQFAKREKHTVVALSVRSGDENFPKSYFFEFLDWFIDAKDSIPIEYQNNARCYLEAEEDDIKIVIVYDRPETDEEINERVLRDRLRVIKLEEEELKTLERLEKKYRGKK